MDLKAYYLKIRQAEAEIAEPEVVVVSLATADGGREGNRSEVPRRVAAQICVEGRARLATPDEAKEFRDQAAEAKKAADQIAAASRMQVTVVSEAELRSLKMGNRPGK